MAKRFMSKCPFCRADKVPKKETTDERHYQCFTVLDKKEEQYKQSKTCAALNKLQTTHYGI